MTSPLPQPSLAPIDALLRRYDGPMPADELLAALAGEPASTLRLRAISRDIDRLVLSVGQSIARRRERLLASCDCQQERSAMDELSRRLAFYRHLGMSLGSSQPPAEFS